MADGPETVDEWLGANMRAIRERRGMSQAELARRMSENGQAWHQSTVARAEAGRQAVRAGELKELAQILGVTVDRLLWLGPEVNAVGLVDRAAGILRESWNEVADATARLQAARDGAKRTIGEFAQSEYRRVHDARTELERELESATLGAAVDEGVLRYERETGDDGTDA